MKYIIEVPDGTKAVNITAISVNEKGQFNLNTQGYDVKDLQKFEDYKKENYSIAMDAGQVHEVMSHLLRQYTSAAMPISTSDGREIIDVYIKNDSVIIGLGGNK